MTAESYHSCMAGLKEKFRHNHVATLESRADLLREETLNGRAYIVAPVVPILEGVHNGEFISFEEMTVWPEMWSGRPLPIDHPMDENNEPLTANSPKVMQESVVGFLFNVIAREDIRGISGELWIDTLKAAEVPGGEEVLRKLQAGNKLEVSTGYFTIVDNIPGEWRNAKSGQIEKFSSSQFQIRPDHLALLPFDTGACNWKDGCGSPRINSAEPVKTNDQNVELHSQETQSVPDVKKDLKINGKQLGKVLAGAIATNADENGSTDHMINRLAAAADITTDKVKELIEGKVDFAPRRWLSMFAAVLDIDPWDIFMAASDDNATTRYAANTENAVPEEKKTETENISENSDAALTTPHNDQDKPCEPCKKSLTAKVLEVLQSIGIVKVSQATEVKEVTKEMSTNAEAKKAKVDALIASEKNKFNESNREWLTALSDEHLDAFEVPATAAVAPATNAAEKKEPEVKQEVKATAPSKDELLSILGVSDDDLKAAKSINEDKKAARNAKIAEITAAANCKFTKAELETFSDATLEKTLEILTPDSPFRTADGVKATTKESQVPVAPSILLAKPAAQEAK